MEHAPAPDPHGLTKTLPASLTTDGSVLGTLPYMSPEQVEGRAADARSDIFAFGVVLYELISGARPFTGRSQADLVASILKEEPRPLFEAQPQTPRGVADVVRTCLEKDPEQRWQSAREVRHALKWMATEPPAIPARPVRVWPWLAVSAVSIALGIGGWLFRPAEPGALGRFEAPVPENATPALDVSVSPDGRTLVFVAEQDGLWLRDFGGLEWRRLPGTEGGVAPFWSPDGRYLAFTVSNTVKKIDVTGGPPETVASLPDASLASGTWSGNGDIVLGSWGGGSGGPLWRVSQTGGSISALTEVDTSKGEFYHTWPTFLPDGRHFLYFRSGPPDIEGMYVGSLDVGAADQSRQRVLAGRVPATYANGHLFFPREGTLMAQPFDTRRFEPRGVPVSVAEDVQISWYYTGAFSASGSGVLAYWAGSVPGTSQFTWVDRQGKPLSTVGSPGPDWNVVLSPDGTRGVAKDAPYSMPGDLWTWDVATGQRTRLTFKKDVYSAGVWSPDGARIAYSAGQFGDTIYEKDASGGADARVLLTEPGLRHFPTSWSRDGFLLYHTENAPRTGYDLWALALRDRRPHLLLGETYNEWAGVFSPDMRWVAYVSLETGTEGQVYVRPFRVSAQTGQPSLAGGKWQVSKDRGNWPQWRVAREIIFSTVPTGTASFAAPVNTAGAVFQSGVPQQLPFPPNARVGSTPQSADDGRRFLIEVSQTPRAARSSISVVLNWPVLLKR